MATTTNYGWTTPDDTSLVKDGAAAIRTLGSSVDTTTKALNPSTTLGDIEYRSSTANTNTRLPIGTTGQVLAVVGGVPAWATTADQTPLTTKGDIFTFTTVDARLGVGANGTVLTADSAEATGLKWAVPASGSTFVGCAVTRYDQSINSATWTALAFTVEDYDTDAFHNNSTNTSRMTIPTGKGGKYQLTASGDFAGAGTGGTFRGIRLYKNGAAYESPTTGAVLRSIFGNVDICTSAIDWTLTLVAGDYLEVFAFQDTGSAKNVNNMFFAVTYLGA